MYKVAYLDSGLAVHAKSYNYREDALKAFSDIRRLLPNAPVRTEDPNGRIQYFGPKPATDSGWEWYESSIVCIWKYYLDANMEKYTGEDIFPCEFLDVVKTYRHEDGFGTQWVLVVHDSGYTPDSTHWIP